MDGNASGWRRSRRQGRNHDAVGLTVAHAACEGTHATRTTDRRRANLVELVSHDVEHASRLEVHDSVKIKSLPSSTTSFGV